MFILGTEHIPKLDIQGHLAYAWELGCRSFDTAFLYKNHESIISALQRYPRTDYELTLKIPAALQSCSQLENLVLSIIEKGKLLYVDTLLIHSPKHVIHPEVIAAFQRLEAAGYIRKHGFSNYTLGHLKALDTLGYRPMVVQNEINPFLQETTFVDYCTEYLIEVQAHSIFAAGKVFTNKELVSMVKLQNLTQILFSWLKKIAVTPIISMKEQNRLLENWKNWHMASEKNSLNSLEMFDTNTRQCRSPEWDEFDMLPKDVYQHILRQFQNQYQP